MDARNIILLCGAGIIAVIGVGVFFSMQGMIDYDMLHLSLSNQTHLDTMSCSEVKVLQKNTWALPADHRHIIESDLDNAFDYLGCT
jgi:hypothetical protein